MNPVFSAWLRGLVSLALRASFLAAGVALMALAVHEASGMAGRRLQAGARLTLASGEHAVLAARALGAARAGTVQLLVEHTSGGWRVQNLSARQPLTIERHGADQQVSRDVRLGADQTLRIAGHAWRLQALGERSLRLTREADGVQWQYDGARLERLGDAAAAEGPEAHAAHCPADGWQQRWRRGWNRVSPEAWRVNQPLQWTGRVAVACGETLPLPALGMTALTLERTAAGWWLRDGPASPGGSTAAQRVCLHPVQDGCLPGGYLAEQRLAIRDGDRWKLGVSVLAVRIEGDQLIATPERRVAIREAAAVGVERGIAVDWTDWAPWAWPLGVSPELLLALAMLGVGLLAAGLCLGPSRFETGPAVAIAFGVMSATLAAVSLVLGPALGAGWQLALVALVLLGTVCGPRVDLTWVATAMAVCLWLLGLVYQARLAACAPDTGPWVAVAKSAGLGAVVWSLLHAVRWLAHCTSWQRVAARRALGEVGLLGAATLALVLMVAELLFGGELGVFGVQPVELFKFSLVVLGAHGLAVLTRSAAEPGPQRSPWRLAIRLLGPVVVFGAAGAVVLVGVSDFSPLLVLAMWTFGVALAWSYLQRRAGVALLLALVAATCVAALVALHSDEVQHLTAMLRVRDVRLSAWLAPERHPVSAEQIQLALRHLQSAGDWGRAPASPWGVPQVQDDMALAGFMGSYGRHAGLALWALQWSYVCVLLACGLQALRQSVMACGHGQQQAWLRYFTAVGGASLILGQLLLTWGSNTNLLPVMGLSAPFLAAGNSLLVFLLAPIHAALHLTVLPSSSAAVPVPHSRTARDVVPANGYREPHLS